MLAGCQLTSKIVSAADCFSTPSVFLFSLPPFISAVGWIPLPKPSAPSLWELLLVVVSSPLLHQIQISLGFP